MALNKDVYHVAADAQAALSLSVNPKRDDQIEVLYHIEIDPPAAATLFELPTRNANGKYVITLRPSEPDAQRFIKIKGTDIAGNQPTTLKIKKDDVKPPDLKTDLPDLTLTVADDPKLEGSALIVVVYTTGLKDSKTVDELKKVERSERLKLVGKSIYLIDQQGLLRRWSPSGNPSLEGLKPFEEKAKFENIGNLTLDAIKQRIVPRLSNADVKTAIVWEDSRDHPKEFAIAENEFKPAPKGYHLFWIGPPAEEQGLGQQLELRFKDHFTPYPDPVDNLSQGMIRVLK